jgi:hypothetical protein
VKNILNSKIKWKIVKKELNLQKLKMLRLQKKRSILRSQVRKRKIIRKEKSLRVLLK